MSKQILLLIGFLVICGGLMSQEKHKLVLNITGFNNSKGNAVIALFNSEKGFPKGEYAYLDFSVKVENNKVELIIEDLAENTYSVMVFHDKNENKQLETNWIGMPKEGVGTSRNHIGIPSFKKTAFLLVKSMKLNIKMVYL